MELVFMLLGWLSFGIAGFCLGRIFSIQVLVVLDELEDEDDYEQE